MTAIMNKNKSNSGEGAYNAILRGIMSGELKPGLIVSEHTLSEMYNVGRTPVREALKRLEGEGFIINSDRKKKIYSLTVDDIREIFDLKMEIEGMVAYKAASSKNKKDVALMEKLLEEMDAIAEQLKQKDDQADSHDIEGWLDIDSRFHDHLYKMAGNVRAKTIIDNLNAQWHRIRVGLSAVTGHLGGSVKEHQRIAVAVLNKEPEVASAAIKAHFNNLKSRIVTLMKTFQN